jgi:hypothetical protein
VLPHDVCVDALRGDVEVYGQHPAEAHRVEHGAGPEHVHPLAFPAPAEQLGHHVDGVRDHERHAREAVLLEELGDARQRVHVPREELQA